MADPSSALRKKTAAVVGPYVATLEGLIAQSAPADEINGRARFLREDLVGYEQMFLDRVLRVETFLRECGCDLEEGDYDV